MGRFSVWIRFFLLAIWPLACVVADQLSKWFSLEYVPLMRHWQFPYGGIDIGELAGIQLALVTAFNTGAAWSLLSQHPALLLVLRIALIVGLVSYWARSLDKAMSWPLALIWAGALSNCWDTLIYGHVVDMISLTFWGYHYPVFNLADSYICIGASWLFLAFNRSHKGQANNVSL